MLLADGESSRLYKELVHDRAVAERVSAWTDDHRGPDQFSVMAVLTDKGKLPDVEAAVDAELAHAAQNAAQAAPSSRKPSVSCARASCSACKPTWAAPSSSANSSPTGVTRGCFAHELSQYLAVTPEGRATSGRQLPDPGAALARRSLARRQRSGKP